MSKTEEQKQQWEKEFKEGSTNMDYEQWLSAKRWARLVVSNTTELGGRIMTLKRINKDKMFQASLIGTYSYSEVSDVIEETCNFQLEADQKEYRTLEVRIAILKEQLKSVDGLNKTLFQDRKEYDELKEELEYLYESYEVAIEVLDEVHNAVIKEILQDVRERLRDRFGLVDIDKRWLEKIEQKYGGE